MSTVIQEPKKNLLIMDEILINSKPVLTEPTFNEEIFKKNNEPADKHARGSCFCLPCSPIDICCYLCR